MPSCRIYSLCLSCVRLSLLMYVVTHLLRLNSIKIQQSLRSVCHSILRPLQSYSTIFFPSFHSILQLLQSYLTIFFPSFMASAAGENLNGRVAIITGASRGIGRAIAIHLHSLGSRVVINYTSSSTQADQLASQLNAISSSSAIAVRADVSDPDQVKLLFDKTQQEFGSEIHILVNSAGVLDPKYPTLSNTTLEDWDSTFNVNTRGAFLVGREASKRLVRGGGGRIIMITTSVVGSLLPGYAPYAASKAAVETMTKILAKELKGTGITANCVAPGAVATELFFAGKTEEIIKRVVDGCPMGRLGKPEDVSGVVGFLASDAGEWINGQVIRANGGSFIS